MSLADFNIAKFNIPISIKRAFDQGKIAESYERMYVVADKFATAEAKRLLAQKVVEYPGSKRRPRGSPGVGELITVQMTKEVSDYRNQRLDFHMNNMIHMLEMHVASRQKE